MSKITRRGLMTAGALTLFGPALLHDESQGAVPTFTGHPAIKSAILNRQTTIFNVASLATGSSRVQTLVLVVNGVVTEVHARRNNIYLTKRTSQSSSIKVISPVDYNRLITAAGGIDTWVNGTQRAANFYAIYNSLGLNPTNRATCPADFAAKSDLTKRIIRQKLSLPEYKKYAPCFNDTLSLNEILQNTLGAPSAMASDDTLMFFRVSADDFFSAWTFEYNTQEGYYGFNAFGVRAIWGIGG